ncbi:MAG: YqgE/AlgH family protein, partial [Pseudomonadota bacterium]
QELDLGDVVDELGIQCAPGRADTPVFFGGPVDLQRGAVLHSLDYRQDDTMLITPSLGLTASRDALRTLCQNGDDAPRQAVLVMGHAGWTAGQLDEEVKRNDWLTIDAMPGLVFGASSDAWSGALHQLGITDLTRLDGRERFAPLPH